MMSFGCLPQWRSRNTKKLPVAFQLEPCGNANHPLQNSLTKAGRTELTKLNPTDGLRPGMGAASTITTGSDAGSAGPRSAASDNSHATKSSSCSSTAVSLAGSEEAGEVKLRTQAGSSESQVDSRNADDELDLMLWRRFRLSSYLAAVPPRWRRLVDMCQYTVVCRPSNDTSLGLQGWRSGMLRRWSLSFPVLAVMDSPGQAAAGEGFLEWPLFDIFKIDLRSLRTWDDYVTSLGRNDRANVRGRTKLFGSFEADGRLVCEVVELGPAAFGGAPEVQTAAVEEDVNNKNSTSSSSTSDDIWEAAPVKQGMKQGHAMQAVASAAVTVVVTQGDVKEAVTGKHTDEEAQPAGQQGRGPRSTVQTPPHVHRSPCRKQQGNQQQRRWEQQPQRPQQSKTSQPQWQRQQPEPKVQQPETQPETQQQPRTLSAKTGKRFNAGRGSRPKEVPAAPPSVPALPPCVTPGSVGEAEALLSQLWDLYERTGTRNGYVECRREYFASLVRRAPGMKAVVVRQGGDRSILAFVLLLLQRESLQLLYTGLQYDNPLVRQAECYFKILLVGIQTALVHNEFVRQHAATAMAKAGAAPHDGDLPAVTDSTAADITSSSSSPVPLASAQVQQAPCAPPIVPASCSPLGSRFGLIDFVDFGPGRRFVKEHLGATGHPVSMYTRGIGPMAHRVSTRLLRRYFDAKQYLNDP